MWQRGRPKVGASENGAMCSYDAGKKMYAELYAFHSVNVNPFSVAMLLFNHHKGGFLLNSFQFLCIV